MHPSPSRSGTGQASAPIRPLARWQGPVFLVNSRLGRFCATPSGSRRAALHPTRVPLLPKLRGQFAEFLDRGSLVRLGRVLPAHLCRFAVRAPGHLAPGLFWAIRAHVTPVERDARRCPSPHVLSGFSPRTRYETGPSMSNGTADQPPRVPPYAQTVSRRCRTVDLLSIAYAFLPRLRPDYP